MKALSFILATIFFMAIANSKSSASFYDNFESSTPTPHSWQEQFSGTQPSCDCDPLTMTGVTFSAQPGDWYVFNKNSVPDISTQVTNNPIPGAAEGNNYLRIHHGTVYPTDIGLAAAFEPWDEPQTAGTITATWKMYIPSGEQAGVWITGKLDNDNSFGQFAATPLFFVSSNGDVRYYENFKLFNAVLDFDAVQADVWQDWKLVTNLDAGSAYLEVDGTASPSFGFNDTFSDPIGANGLVFLGENELGSEFYIDDVRVESQTPLGSAYSADFDNDGKVDGLDLSIWQASYAEDAEADADDDGDSDGRDFLMWQRQFGSGVVPTSSALAIPEPNSALLVATLTLLPTRKWGSRRYS